MRWKLTNMINPLTSAASGVSFNPSGLGGCGRKGEGDAFAAARGPFAPTGTASPFGDGGSTSALMKTDFRCAYSHHNSLAVIFRIFGLFGL